MSSSRPRVTDPGQALLLSRIIWGAMLGGLVAFGVIVAVLIRSSAAPGAVLPDFSVAVMWAVAIVASALGMFARGQVFKRGWMGEVVEPQAYITGNIVAWAACEGPAFASLALCLVERDLGAFFGPAMLSIGLLALLWPNGRALRPVARADDFGAG